MEVLYFMLNLLFPLLLAAGVWPFVKYSKKLGLCLSIVMLLLIVARPMLSNNAVWEYSIFPWTDYLYFQGWHVYLFPAFLFGLWGYLPNARKRRALLFLALLLYTVNIYNVGWILTSRNPPTENKIDENGICRQTTNYTCGAASCVTLLRLYGLESTEGEMANLCLTRRQGGIYDLGAMRGLMIQGRKIGMKPKIQNMNYDELAEMKRPGLLSIRIVAFLNHMVCLLEAKPDHVILGDPGGGRKTLPRKDFEAVWHGNFIWLEEAGK